MLIEYWEKVTREALEEALKARDGLDTEEYSWIDELQLRIKHIHRKSKNKGEIPNIIESSEAQLEPTTSIASSDNYSIRDIQAPSVRSENKLDSWEKWEGKF